MDMHTLLNTTRHVIKDPKQGSVLILDGMLRFEIATAGGRCK